MVRFKQSVVTSQPAERVFALLSNPENDPRWSSASRRTRKASPGPIAVGATFEQAGRFLGRRLALSLEVTAYEPNRRFGMKVASGPIEFAGVREVEVVPEGTRVTFTGRGQAPRPLRIAEPLLAWAAARQLERDLARLKDVLEGPGYGASKSDDRALVFVTAAQLGVGLAGLALGVRRRHAYDVPLMHGRPEAIARDALWMGTALSAPAPMLAVQALATARLSRGPSERAVKALGVLGAMMVPGYLGERLTREGLLRGAWDTAELRVALAGTALATGMVALAARNLTRER